MRFANGVEAYAELSVSGSIPYGAKFPAVALQKP